MSFPDGYQLDKIVRTWLVYYVPDRSNPLRAICVGFQHAQVHQKELNMTKTKIGRKKTLIDSQEICKGVSRYYDISLFSDVMTKSSL